MDPFIKSLHGIAARGGEALLIDTTEEVASAAVFFAALQPLEALQPVAAEGLEVLKEYGLQGRFQINPVFRGCVPEGCFSLLIPLEAETGYGIFVRSGGMFFTEQHYVSLSHEAWKQILNPLLRGAAPDAATERHRLAEAAGRFEIRVSPPEDQPGFLGNIYAIFSPHGQQDCVDKTAGLLQLLGALQMRGVLRHHRFGESGTTVGSPFTHLAARLEELATGTVFAVDTWNNPYFPEILPESVWKDRNSQQFEHPRP